ncbi:KUP/HAK/KT family potassium transporter [Marseilla massiliensis]|uniref:Probable potassium transport system protein Kup n=1 Tax=Marseilla massiliensis TaxID=1841864 RepID=A0A939B8X4_9BACT|nr:KUP/HAK/KT family potassium transporter [Marseilla massiliensis]MBM6674863.1 KUP/HAK/KT family potassium transporter [Marseilla massiliensis]
MADLRHAATATTAGKVGLAGLLMTLGIVFGDIGTSPLYVMKAIVSTGETLYTDYILGALSCIIWTLTLQTTVKYVLIALRADNNGEGGILALYALLRRHRRRWIYVIAVIGASTLLADGVITPAITVTTAIEGLEGISPDLPVMPVVIAIITVIFFVQRFGTEHIGRTFGTFMLLWFLLLGVAGAAALTACPQVLKAFNPYYAVRLLVESPSWFFILGAVFLCTTGAEALYSDLGHCGRRNITISWLFVKAMLILNYLGQGAWILANAGRITAGVNPFYAIVPQDMLLFAIVMATGAAIVASQALISGSFSILSEAMNLHFWPRMRIKHPTNVKGQLFIPAVNLTMYVGVVLTVLLFRDSSRMEAAYGLAITITMLMTTLLLGFYLRMSGTARVAALAFVGAYCVIEGIFLAANLSKFMAGGWFTLLIGGLLCFIMLVWVAALKIRRRHLSSKRTSDYYGIISDIKADDTIPKYASNLVYVNHSHGEGSVDDKLVYSIINKQPKRADHYWLLNLEFVDTPDTLEYTFTPLVKDTLFSVTMRIGFRIEPRVSLYLRQIVEDLVADGKLDLTSTYPSLRKNGIPGDFRFVIIHRIYYPEDSHNRRQNLLMSLYAIIRKIGIDEPNALGLDTSVVVVERVPLIISGRAKHLRRIEKVVDEE